MCFDGSHVGMVSRDQQSSLHLVVHYKRWPTKKKKKKLAGQPSDLDLMIKSCKLDCSHNISKTTLGALLQQPDFAGSEFQDLEDATVCSDADEDEDEECYPGSTYITVICSGKPILDSGQFHNHCNGLIDVNLSGNS